MRRMSYIKMVAMVGIVAAAIAFGSIAWFTQSREVEGSGVQMRADDLPFDIATKGTNIRNSSLIAAERPEYETGESRTITENNENVVYYTADSLRLMFTPETDNPKTEANESIPPDIAPGSSGELSLYVIPKTNDSLNVKVSLNVAAFAEIDNVNNSGQKKVIEIKDAADFAAKAYAVGNTVEAAKATDYVNAAKYLRGHILFFGAEGDTTNQTESSRYYYTTPYTTRIIKQPITAGNEGKAVKVPVYWMWTNTLGQIALPDNISSKRNGYPILNDSNTGDKAKIKTYLISNKEEIFANSGSNTETYINAVTATVTAENFNNTAFTELSTGYNQADYLIGTKIAYILIEVTVEEDS